MRNRPSLVESCPFRSIKSLKRPTPVQIQPTSVINTINFRDNKPRSAQHTSSWCKPDRNPPKLVECRPNVLDLGSNSVEICQYLWSLAEIDKTWPNAEKTCRIRTRTCRTPGNSGRIRQNYSTFGRTGPKSVKSTDLGEHCTTLVELGPKLAESHRLTAPDQCAMFRRVRPTELPE